MRLAAFAASPDSRLIELEWHHRNGPAAEHGCEVAHFVNRRPPEFRPVGGVARNAISCTRYGELSTRTSNAIFATATPIPDTPI